MNVNQTSNLLSLESALMGFDSEDKIDNCNSNIRSQKKIEINFNDKDFIDKNIDNAKKSKFILQKKQPKFIKKIETKITNNSIQIQNKASLVNNNITNISQNIKELNNKDFIKKSLSEKFVYENLWKDLELIKEISIEFKSKIINYSYACSQTDNINIKEEGDVYCLENNKNDLLININDPLKEFFLLTFQSIKANYGESIEIINMINPDIIYKETQFLNIPFHTVN